MVRQCINCTLLSFMCSTPQSCDPNSTSHRLSYYIWGKIFVSHTVEEIFIDWGLDSLIPKQKFWNSFTCEMFPQLTHTHNLQFIKYILTTTLKKKKYSATHYNHRLCIITGTWTLSSWFKYKKLQFYLNQILTDIWLHVKLLESISAIIFSIRGANNPPWLHTHK